MTAPYPFVPLLINVTLINIYAILETEKPPEEAKETPMQREDPPYSAKLREDVADYL